MGNLPSGLHLAVGAYNMAGVQDLVDQGLQPLCPSCGVHLGGEGSRVDVKGQSRHPHPVRHGQGSLPLTGVVVQLPLNASDGSVLCSDSVRPILHATAQLSTSSLSGASSCQVCQVHRPK